jgi:hypothetical protein
MILRRLCELVAPVGLFLFLTVQVESQPVDRRISREFILSMRPLAFALSLATAMSVAAEARADFVSPALPGVIPAVAAPTELSNVDLWAASSVETIKALPPWPCHADQSSDAHSNKDGTMPSSTSQDRQPRSFGSPLLHEPYHGRPPSAHLLVPIDVGAAPRARSGRLFRPPRSVAA